MTRHLITICILVLISRPSFGQDTLVTTGYIFRVWEIAKNSNDTIKEKRNQWTKERLNLYSNKKELMYQIVIEFPDQKKMGKLRRKDKTLRKMELYEITDSYLWGKLDEYDMLFKPGFEIVDDSENWIYIKCTKGQLDQITEIDN